MFGGGGGSSQRPVIQQTPAPTETDPQVQNKKASRLTQQRYQKGFMSTIQSNESKGLGAGTIATNGGNAGSVQQLG